MKKRLLPLVVSCFVVVPFLSFGVGLGSVRTYSDLNERLRAEIPVLLVKKRGQMSVALAPDAVFSQRGITRGKDVRNLRFSLVKKAQRYYVKVSSIEPITTPYLNFILELSGEDGKTYREYAVFLDPASSGTKHTEKKQSSIVVSHKKVTDSSKRKTTSTKVAVRKNRNNTDRTNTVKKTKKRPANLPMVTGKVGQYGPVKRGETLTGIALRVRPSKKISVHHMIKLLEEANPRLKYGLKADSTLKIPTIKGYSTYQASQQEISEDSQHKKFVPEAVVNKVVKEISPIKTNKTINKKIKQKNGTIVATLVEDSQNGAQPISKPISTSADMENAKVEMPKQEETTQISSITKAPKNNDHLVTGQTESVGSAKDVLPNDINEKKPDGLQVVENKIVSSTVADSSITSETNTETDKSNAIEKVQTSESGKGGFELPFGLSLMPLLAGAGTLLLGLLALLFVRKKREAVDTKDIVLLDEDDVYSDNNEDIVDDNVAIDNVAINEATASVPIADVAENQHTELDVPEVNNAGVLSNSHLEQASKEDKSFTPELFDLDKETDVNVSQPVSELSNEVISESEGSIETEIAEQVDSNEVGGMSFNLDEYSEEVAEQKESVQEEISEASDNMLDFNLDEFSQEKTQETSIQSDENIISKEITSEETNDGLTFEVNDHFTDDLPKENTRVGNEFVSDVNSIDFELDKESAIVNTEASLDKVDNSVTDKLSEKMNISKPFAIDKVKGKNIDISGIHLVSGQSETAEQESASVISGHILDDVTASKENADSTISNEDKIASENHLADKGQGYTEIEMKLAMAETFISISNNDRAKELLQQVMQMGTAEQIEKAKSILREIS